MLQITEDTPPDMLAGAMDLTVHLPTGRAVKMAVERSTPMMDLLVQITTNHHLQLSNYTLQALGMAPSSEHSDKVLPYKPNTPIGTLDTQHIKVIPKARTLPVPKNVPPGHQPFESTFRLKVHLPRSQLYVTRVSRNVLLEDIMKKVCEEKNLDPGRYEFKHPGNLNEVLDPKLTLSDYQVTEIYVVAKGTVSLTQAFSTNDIMALRKEEERKQMHNKTGGGVFNLIFRKGKSSMGSGSISSDTRSISPTHSDDSRSVTPPAVKQKIITSPKKEPPPPERPKPPQRKRRLAPKPPGEQTEGNRRIPEETRRDSEDSRITSDNLRVQPEEMRKTSGEKSSSNGLTICHSRNSSDSSGYHEASVLSENGNTSLPRRPKSAFVTAGDLDKVSKMHSQSTTNLSKMSGHSKSTTSLALGGRKKKSAPLPPPTIRASNPAINIVENASPVVVASQPPAYQQALDAHGNTQDTLVVDSPLNPIPKPRSRLSATQKVTPVVRKMLSPPKPEKRHNMGEDYRKEKDVSAVQEGEMNIKSNNKEINAKPIDNDANQKDLDIKVNKEISLARATVHLNHCPQNSSLDNQTACLEDMKTQKEKQPHALLKTFPKSLGHEISQQLLGDRPPEVVGVIPKKTNNDNLTHNSNISKNQTESNASNEKTVKSCSYTTQLNSPDDLFDLNDEMFSKPSKSVELEPRSNILNQLYGIHDLDDCSIGRQNSISSIRSLQSLQGFSGGLRKWNNLEELDDLSLASSMGPNSNSWVLGDQSETESFSSHQALDSLVSITSSPSINIAEVKKEEKYFGSTDSGIAQEIVEKLSETEEVNILIPPPSPQIILKNLPERVVKPKDQIVHKEVKPEIGSDNIEDISSKEDFEPEERLIEPIIVPKEFTDPKPVEESDDIDWQYQIPSPPRAFRDTSPAYFIETPKSDCKDSVVTSPELFEKLKTIEDHQFDKETVISDVSSVISEEDKPLCSNLSLENLEKRKTLVYNRELTTSLKMSESEIIPSRTEGIDSFSSSLSKFESTFMEIQQSSHTKGFEDSKYVQKSVVHTTNTLPNFKISTYDRPKQKIKVFEDDTIRSNTENFTKIQKSSFEQVSKAAVPSLSRSFLGRSMENISFKPPRDTSLNYLKEEREYRYSKMESSTAGVSKSFGPMSSVFRSESFSTDSKWSPSKPVFRSKSQLSLNSNKQNEKQIENTESHMSRSNSLYDVSGLQSLGVMRLIQNKLSTPTSSMENINQFSKYQNPTSVKVEHNKTDAISNRKLSESHSIVSTSTTIPEEIVSTQEKTLPVSVEPKSGNTVTSFVESSPAKGEQKEDLPKATEKIYKYRGPPSISMSTWSERPKVPVNIKEDADYKLSNHNVNSKLMVTTTNNDIISNNTVEVRNNLKNNTVKDPRGVSIKVNGTEAFNGNQYQSGGNVVIRIGSVNGESRPKTIDNERFISHTTAVGYRKPFAAINNNQSTQKPHSIAVNTDLDNSRVPVVRSFELKKPYKDLGNTSVTQIYHQEDSDKSNNLERTRHSSELSTRFGSKQNRNNEPEDTSELSKRFATMNNRNSYSNNNCQDFKEPKPVFRVSSYKPLGAAPVVRGFRQNNDVSNNRMTWGGATCYNTLPAKSKETDTILMKGHVPFSQSNLRRAESTKISEKSFVNHETHQKLSSGGSSFTSLPSIQKPEGRAPPPPLMPKNPVVVRKPVEPVADHRDQLMSAIRNFGGKKGLKTVKV